MSSAELLPCPFCGGPGYSVRTVNGTQMFKVGCASCGFELKAAWYRDEEQPTKDLVGLWNTREVAREERPDGGALDRGGVVVHGASAAVGQGRISAGGAIAATPATKAKPWCQVCGAELAGFYCEACRRTLDAEVTAPLGEPPALAPLDDAALEKRRSWWRTSGGGGDVCEMAILIEELFDEIDWLRNRLVNSKQTVKPTATHRFVESEAGVPAREERWRCARCPGTPGRRWIGEMEFKCDGCDGSGYVPAAREERPDEDSRLATGVQPDALGSTGGQYAGISDHREVRAVAAPLGEPPAPPERCICAAVRFADGRIVRGHRHDACFRTAEGWTPQPQRDGHVQGFITSANRFVTRKAGALIQNAAGIKSAHTGQPVGDELFSEDLYFDAHDHVAWNTPYAEARAAVREEGPQPNKEDVHARARQWVIQHQTSDGTSLYDSWAKVHYQTAIHWMTEFALAEARAGAGAPPREAPKSTASGHQPPVATPLAKLGALDLAGSSTTEPAPSGAREERPMPRIGEKFTFEQSWQEEIGLTTVTDPNRQELVDRQAREERPDEETQAAPQAQTVAAREDIQGSSESRMESVVAVEVAPLGELPALAPLEDSERTQRLARCFAQEWLRPDNPDQATPALVDTLMVAMLAFYSCARQADLRGASRRAGENT